MNRVTEITELIRSRLDVTNKEDKDYIEMCIRLACAYERRDITQDRLKRLIKQIGE